MRPDDANIVGNVHGGTILKMIEEAGGIISTRHCNTQSGDRCVAALARVERTDFLHPMLIGEVAHVSAELTYTSRHSVEVQVNVMAENILTGVVQSVKHLTTVPHTTLLRKHTGLHLGACRASVHPPPCLTNRMEMLHKESLSSTNQLLRRLTKQTVQEPDRSFFDYAIRHAKGCSLSACVSKEDLIVLTFPGSAQSDEALQLESFLVFLCCIIRSVCSRRTNIGVLCC
ncbi:UNVERIFIED_CONTAM: hypothetical protein FKN15_029437 [Acipenser sinensis]